MKTILKEGLRYLMFVVVIFAFAASSVFFRKTLVAWWLPVEMGLVMALATLPLSRKWRWLTNSEDKMYNAFCHLVCIGSIGSALFLTGNYGLADSSSMHQEEVIVQKKYQKTIQRARVGGKRNYSPKGTRKEYFLEVAFKNGTVKKLVASPATFNKAKEGKPKVLTLQKGLFGIPVITKGV